MIMKCKVVVIYMNGKEEVVYDGDFTPQAMRLQGEWVKRAKRNPEIKAVLWR